MQQKVVKGIDAISAGHVDMVVRRGRRRDEYVMKKNPIVRTVTPEIIIRMKE
jgi:hypothetical protein